MKTISISQFKGNIKKHFDSVAKSREVLLVSGNSEDGDVVMVAFKDYKALNETSYLLSTEANQKRLKESIQQWKAKKTRKYKVE